MSNKVHVKTGDQVKKGQLLFEYDLSSIQESLEEAQLDLDRLKNEASSLNERIATLEKEKKKASQVFVGFAAETNDVIEHAQGKLMRKNLDMIVANDVTRPGAGFDVDTNIVTLITQKGEQALPLMSKAEVAGHILDHVLELYFEKANAQ